MEKMKKIDRLKVEIANLESWISYMKSSKLSRGLNAHDIKIYENYKTELESKQAMLILEQGSKQLSA